MSSTLSCFIAAVICMASSGIGWAANPAADPEMLGACAKEMRTAALFETRERASFKVLVTRFDGADAGSKKLGVEAAINLSQALPEYFQAVLGAEAKAAGLDPDDLQVKYVPCGLTQHTDARAIGQAWGADLVFWGLASCSALNPEECRKYERVAANRIKARIKELPPVVINAPVVQYVAPGGKGVIGADLHVEAKLVPLTGGSLKTSVTVVAWRGIDVRGDRLAMKDTQAVMDLDFPKLASAKGAALFNFVLGAFAFRSGIHGLAAASFERAKDEVFAGKEKLPELLRLVGTSYMIAGRPEQGLAALEEALVGCGVNDDGCRSTALANVGWAQDRLGDKQKALSYYEQALPLDSRVGDTLGEATTLNNIGSVYDALGDKQKALSYYEQALPLRRRVGDASGEATTLNNIGLVYSALGDKQKALSYYDQALALSRRVGDASGEATTLNNVGGVYSALGDKQKALSYYEQALPLRRRVGDASGEATTLSNIGLVYDDLDDKQKALSYYEQALPLSRRVGDASGEATTLHNIGLVYSALGDKQKALSYCDQALALSRRVGDASGEATTLNNIGLVYDALGDKQKALSYYEQALPLRRRVGDASGEATTLNNIGGVYDDLGDKQKALSYYDQARRGFVKVNKPWTLAVVLDNMGQTLLALGRTEESVARFRDAAALYLRRPDVKEAIGSLRLALGAARRGRLLVVGNELLGELRTLGLSGAMLTLESARLLSRAATDTKAIESAWQSVRDQSASLPPDDRASLLRAAAAGTERLANSPRWSGCFGILAGTPVPASQAASLGILPGDILLRYAGACLDETDDLATRTPKTLPTQDMPLDLWRAGKLVTLRVKGGKLGLPVEPF